MPTSMATVEVDFFIIENMIIKSPPTGMRKVNTVNMEKIGCDMEKNLSTRDILYAGTEKIGLLNQVRKKARINTSDATTSGFLKIMKNDFLASDNFCLSFFICQSSPSYHITKIMSKEIYKFRIQS